MKRHRLSLILLSLLVAGLVSTLFVSNVNASVNDLDFTFESEVLYSESRPAYDEVFNVKNQTSYSGDYPATYSFTEASLGSVPDNWTEETETIRVNSTKNNHNNILEFYGNYPKTYQLFENQSYGVMEYWIFKESSDADSQIYFSLEESGVNMGVRMEWLGDYIRYRDLSGTWQYPSGSPLADTWNHFKFIFKCTSNRFDLIINGGLFIDQGEFYTDVDCINKFYLKHYNGNYPTEAYRLWIDAIGYSWLPIYDFDNDTIGEEPLGWISNNGVGCTSLIKDTLDGNTKVLELQDNSASQRSDIYKIFDKRIDQIIEFKVAKSSIGVWSTSNIYLKEGTTSVIWFYLTENDFVYDDGWGADFVKENFIVADTFFNVRVKLNDSANTFDCYINDVLELNDGAFYSSSTYSIDTINLRTDITASSYSFYIDDIFIESESEYQIGDNIMPLFNITNDLIVKGDEFAFDYNGIQEEVRILNDEELINGWEVSDSQNDVSVIESSESFDREVRFFSDTAHTRRLEKSLDLTTDGVLNLTMIMTYLNMGNDGSSLYFGLFRSAIYEFSLIRLYYSVGEIYLQCMDADRGSYTNLLILDSTSDLVREFTFLTSQDSLVKFRYKTNNSVDNTYYFPKIDNATNYYHNVILSSSMNDAGGSQEFHFDSLSIAVNGTTLGYVRDYSAYMINLNISNWNSKEHNLINLDVNGYSGFSAGDSASFESIRGLINYIPNSFINAYNLTFSFSNPYMAFITNESITISEVKISGVKLNQGGHGYSLIFSYGNIDIDKSYFYVDSSNRLRYSLTINDNYTEYIQGKFNIVDVESENRSVSFLSNIDGVSEGFLSIDYYSGGNTLIEFPYYQTNTIVILPQIELITEFTILITDNDLYYNGLCTGFISNIKLIYNPDLSVTISTLALVSIIVPLIILVVPSLTIHKKFGSTGAIIMFILMAVVCVASELIPMWLFFVIAISSIGFLFVKPKTEGMF